MAGPTVTLTFAGDSSQLQKSLGNVGSSSQKMGKEVGSASKQATKAGGGLNRFGNAADAADTRAMGFRDALTGIQDSMAGVGELARGNTFEGLMLLGAGFADIGSSLYNAFVPALQSGVNGLRRMGTWLKTTRVVTMATTAAQWGMTAAQRALNLAMRANPIGVVITVLGALVGALIWAWNNSETFRNIVMGALDGIASAAQWAWGNVIKPTFDAFVAAGQWVGRAFGAVGDTIKSVWDGIVNAIKGAINWVIGVINSAIGGINSLIEGVNNVPGVSIPTIPRVPTLHTGGRVPGAPGTETMAMLQAGERVTPASQANREARGGGGASVTFSGNTDTAVANMIMRLIRSGDLQIQGA